MNLRWGAALVLVAATAGCSDSDQAAGDRNSPSVSEPASAANQIEGGPCALLDPGAVTDLTGQPLEGTERTYRDTTQGGCDYGRLDDVGLEVTQFSASVWANSLPGIVDELRIRGAAGSPRLVEQLEKHAKLVERGETIAPQRACRLFSDMLELRNGVAGSDWDVAYVPDREDPQVMSAQACIGGTYTSIVVGRPDLQAGSKIERTVVKALLDIA